MKKFSLLVLALLAFAPSAQAAAPDTAQYWRDGGYSTGDGAIVKQNGTAKNIPVCIEWAEVLCNSSICVFAVQNYSTVATGSTLPGQMYPLTSTTGTHRFEINQCTTVGAYHNDITGSTYHRYKLSTPPSPQ